jgi:succinate dehydrogenase / fumarate reductase cytochrome b subunit
MKSTAKVSWASQNMPVLGLVVVGFLAIHLSHFWAKMQLQEWLGSEPIKGSALIVDIFSNLGNVIMHVIGILALIFC